MGEITLSNGQATSDSQMEVCFVWRPGLMPLAWKPSHFQARLAATSMLAIKKTDERLTDGRRFVRSPPIREDPSIHLLHDRLVLFLTYCEVRSARRPPLPEPPPGQGRLYQHSRDHMPIYIGIWLLGQRRPLEETPETDAQSCSTCLTKGNARLSPPEQLAGVQEAGRRSGMSDKSLAVLSMTNRQTASHSACSQCPCLAGYEARIRQFGKQLIDLVERIRTHRFQGLRSREKRFSLCTISHAFL